MDQLKMMGVLLVDDDISIQIAMKHFFGGNVRKFKAVESAEKAAKCLIQEGPWDIIFCDYELPGMSGMDFLSIVRDKWPEVLTVMITANADKEIAEKAGMLGVVELIQKPFSTQRITECLCRLIQEREST